MMKKPHRSLTTLSIRVDPSFSRRITPITKTICRQPTLGWLRYHHLHPSPLLDRLFGNESRRTLRSTRYGSLRLAEYNG